MQPISRRSLFRSLGAVLVSSDRSLGSETVKRRRCVLSVDSDLGFLSYMEVLLARAGFDVKTAMSGEAAIEYLRETELDLVTLGIALPAMSGFRTLDRIRELKPLIPVIMISGWGSTFAREEARRRGANEYLRKGFESAELERVLQAALGRF